MPPRRAPGAERRHSWRARQVGACRAHHGPGSGFAARRRLDMGPPRSTTHSRCASSMSTSGSTSATLADPVRCIAIASSRQACATGVVSPVGRSRSSADGRTHAGFQTEFDPGRVLSLLAKGPIVGTLESLLARQPPAGLKLAVEGRVELISPYGRRPRPAARLGDRRAAVGLLRPAWPARRRARRASQHAPPPRGRDRVRLRGRAPCRMRPRRPWSWWAGSRR
jgi:hypothetical protein